MAVFSWEDNKQREWLLFWSCGVTFKAVLAKLPFPYLFFFFSNVYFGFKHNNVLILEEFYIYGL